MNGKEYVLLAFKANVTTGEGRINIYEYEIPLDMIGRARTLLYDENIPHYVKKSPKGTGLLIYTVDKSVKLENIGLKAKELKVSSSGIHITSLINSAVRIHFIKSGWRQAIGKLYNVKMEDGSYINGLIKLYRAVKIASDTLPSDTKVLMLDPAIKVEFTSTLSELKKNQNYYQLVDSVTWVKLKDHMISFYISHDFSKSTILQNRDLKLLLKNVEQELAKYAGIYVNFSCSADEVVFAKPRSLELSNYLKSRIAGLSLDQFGRVIVPLCQDVLVPVPSMENVSIFMKTVEEKISLTMTPQKRYEKLVDILKTINISRLEHPGLKIEIDLSEPIAINKEFIQKSLIHNYVQLNGEKIADPRKLVEWEPVFNREKKRLLLLVSLHFPSQISDEYDKLVKQVFNRIYRRLSDLFDILVIRVNPTLEDLDRQVESKRARYLKYPLEAYDEKYSVLLYHEDADERGDLIGRFYYELANRGYYPHVLNLTDIIEKLIKKDQSGGADHLRLLNFKILSIIRSFAVRTGNTNLKINPPDELKNYVVAGIDATVTPTIKGYVYPVIAVCILKPDGTHTVIAKHGSALALNESEALATGIKTVVEKYGERIIAIVNRTSLRGIIERLSTREIELLKHGKLVLVGASKTHSYSRIVVREKRNDSYTYLNVPFNDVGLIVKFNTINENINGESVPASKYLAVTTTYSTEKLEYGTIKPVLMNIVVKDMNHDEIAKYIVSLSHFARVSSTWVPSLPWPLHYANNLCKKVHRIADSLVSSGKVIPMQALDDRVIRYL